MQNNDDRASVLGKLAKERQTHGYQDKPGIYIAVDKGFDTLLRGTTNSGLGAEAGLEMYTQTCEHGLRSAFGVLPVKGILLKLVQLGIFGPQFDASTQVERDLIAGPFATESEAKDVSPFVLHERYGWAIDSIREITFHSLCVHDWSA